MNNLNFILFGNLGAALKKGNYSLVAANGKVLMRLIGLDTQNENHKLKFKNGKISFYYNLAVQVESVSFSSVFYI